MPLLQPDAVFIGTVLQTASSSVAEVEPAADTVVVRVDQVVSAAPAFHDHLGEPITVALPDGVEVAEGDVHVFQAMAWIFGTGLAVRAISVGDQPVPRGGAHIAGQCLGVRRSVCGAGWPAPIVSCRVSSGR